MPDPTNTSMPNLGIYQSDEWAARMANYQSSQPVQNYNWMATLSSAVPAVAQGVMGGIQAAQGRKDRKNQERLVDGLMAQYMAKPIINPYSNLPVATQAAKLKAEETDQALANTLDTIRASGYSAGGATALARAAEKSQRTIASEIETQEVANAKLEAKGKLIVQSAEFGRLGEQMDFEQSKYDEARSRELSGMENLTGSLSSLGQLGVQLGKQMGTVGGDNTDDLGIPSSADDDYPGGLGPDAGEGSPDTGPWDDDNYDPNTDG